MKSTARGTLKIVVTIFASRKHPAGKSKMYLSYLFRSSSSADLKTID